MQNRKVARPGSLIPGAGQVQSRHEDNTANFAENQAGEFFEMIFDDDGVDEANLIVVWSLPGKRPSFHASIESATDDVMARNGRGEDVYFGCGLYRPGITRGRGKAADVTQITCVWADVDFGEGHKGNKTYAADEAEAVEIVRGTGIEPSLIVHSGHGLHVYWFLSEPMTVSDGAAEFVKQWQDTIRAVAQKRGCTIDATHDLARVLRVAGTSNRKDAHDPLPVKIIIGGNRRRYEPDDFEAWFQEPNAGSTVQGNGKGDPVPVGGLVFDLDAAPPGWIKLALQYSPRFVQTWEYRRTDFDDQTPSVYRYALISAALAVKSTPREITNLVAAWYRKHGINGESLQKVARLLPKEIAKLSASREGVAV